MDRNDETTKGSNRLGRGFRRLALVLFAVLFVLTLLPASAGAASPAWRILPTANAGKQGNDLRGMAALSPTDAWAVGSSFDEAQGATVPMAQHWDGAGWTLVPVASDAPGGLSAVGGSSSTDVWAVGYASSPNGAEGLIEHWDGDSWEVVEAPAPPGTYVNTIFTDVLALAPDDAWAVGRWSIVPDAPPRPLIERWNGEAWQIVDAPEFDTWTELYAVSGTGPDDVWAVGNTEVFVADAWVERALIEHWDGEAWSVYTLPAGTKHRFDASNLEDVVAISPSDVWAVGEVTTARRTRNLSLHFDGEAWTRVPVANPSDDAQMLAGVAALAGGRVFAVGTYRDEQAGRFRTLVERWDGERWRVVRSDNRRTGGELFEVAATPGFQFAVGQAWSNRLHDYRTLGLQRQPA